jgi:hypothetical protein
MIEPGRLNAPAFLCAAIVGQMGREHPTPSKSRGKTLTEIKLH